MSNKTFYQFFGLTSVVAIIMTLLLAQLESIQNHLAFLLITIILFMVFTFWAFYNGQQNLRLSNKQAFSRFFLKSIGLKFLLTILLIVIYKFGFKPINNSFGIPFILIYLLFSFCENYALIKLSNPSE